MNKNKSSQTRKLKSKTFAMDLEPTIRPMVQQGYSANKIAQELTSRHIPTPNGKLYWYAATVTRVLRQLDANVITSKANVITSKANVITSKADVITRAKSNKSKDIEPYNKPKLVARRPINWNHKTW